MVEEKNTTKKIIRKEHQASVEATSAPTTKPPKPPKKS
jgi:hypothetical protein